MKLKGKILSACIKKKYKESKRHDIDEKHKNKSFEQKEGLKNKWLCQGTVDQLITFQKSFKEKVLLV